MRARHCGHPDCLARLDAACAARKREMEATSVPGEPMIIVHTSHGDCLITRRLADADLALERVTMCGHYAFAMAVADHSPGGASWEAWNKRCLERENSTLYRSGDGDPEPMELTGLDVKR